MARAKKKIFTALRLGAGLALLGVAGHFAGRQAAVSGWFLSARVDSGSGRPGGEATVPVRPRPAEINRDRLAVAMKRLTALMRTCPDLRMDREGQEELQSLLVGLSPEELAEIFARLSFPLDRVVAMKIGAAWAQQDPQGALQAALASGAGSPEWAIGVFGEWGNNHPAAALAWLESGEVPEALQKEKGRLYEEVLCGTGLLERDFRLATDCIAKMAQKDAGQVLTEWGGAYAGDAGMRDQLVAFAKSSGRPMDYAMLNAGLVSRWPQEDPVTMMNYLIGLKDYLQASTAPPEVQMQVDATAVGVAVMREYDRSALEWWMDRHSDSAEVPDVLALALNGWISRYPDKVQQWFAEQPPSPQVDAMRASLAGGFLSVHDFEKAAAQLGAIADEKVGRDLAERLNYVWSGNVPQAAAQWRADHPEWFPEK